MADRRVKVVVEAEIAGYRRAMDEAAKAARKVREETDATAKSSEAAGGKAAKGAERVAEAQKKAADAAKRHKDVAMEVADAQKRLDDALASKNVAGAAAAAKDLSDAQAKLKAAGEQATQAQKDLDVAVSKQGDALGRLAGFTRTHADDMQAFGGALTVFGTGLAGLAAGAGKAAMDWESAWAGVTKTNEGTEQQLADLEQGLRDMTGVLPASHAEIAAVAEAAGQLGVGIEDVQGFTKVMIDLGESTNMTAEQAASDLAKFSNIMGTMEREGAAGMGRLGAVIVDLGNNFATTEQDIVDMSMRLAGVGKQMNMHESDVMALATAMSSVGIEAEAGGTAMSTVMKRIDSAVRNGGDALQKWASIAGVSADEFKQAWETDAAGALDTLVTGLGNAGAAGEDMNAMLADLGIKGIRESDALIRLAGASGLLGDALEVGSEAWKANIALTKEAEQRYKTAESRIAIAWNRIKDAAITTGGAILPAVAGVADAVADVADAFGSLPSGVQSGLGVLAGVGGAATVAAGGFLMLAPRMVDTWDAARRLAQNFPALNKGMDNLASGARNAVGHVGGLGKALGIVATAATVGIGVGSMVSTGDLANIDRLTASLTNLGGEADYAKVGIQQLDEAFTGKGNWFDGLDVGGLEEAFRIMGNPSVADNVDNITSKILTFGTRGSTNMEFVKKNFEQLDTTLAGMVNSGSADQAIQAFEQIAQKAESAGLSTDQLNEIFPNYQSALMNVEAQANNTANATGKLGEASGQAAQDTQAAADAMDRLAGINAGGVQGIADAMAVLADESVEADEKLDGVLDALTRLGVVQSTAIQATGDYAAAVRDLAGSLKENGKNLDVTTEKGKANMDALIGLRDAGTQLAEANARAGESQGVLRDNLTQTYEDLVKGAQQMGATAGEADYLARQLMGIPEGVNIHTAMDDHAKVIAEATGQAINEIPGYTGVTIAVSEDGTVGSVQQKINSVTGKKETIFVSDDGTVSEVQQKIISVNGVDRTVWVDDQGTIMSTQKDIDAIRDTDVTAHVHANKKKAEQDINHTSRDRVASVDALANVNRAETSLTHLVRKRITDVFANAQTSKAEGLLSWLTRGRTVSIATKVVSNLGGAFGKLGNVWRSQGGRVPAYADGGRLPYTGLGTDKIMGISSVTGQPTAWVDDLEWVINRRSSDKYNRLLNLVNRDDPSVRHLAGYAAGGRPSGREWSGSEYRAQVTVQAPSAVYSGPSAGDIAAALAPLVGGDVYLDSRKVGAVLDRRRLT